MPVAWMSLRFSVATVAKAEIAHKLKLNHSDLPAEPTRAEPVVSV